MSNEATFLTYAVWFDLDDFCASTDYSMGESAWNARQPEIDALTASRDQFRTRVEEMTQTLDILTSQLGPEKPNLAAEITRRDTIILKARGIVETIERHSNVSDQTWELLTQLRAVIG